MIRQTITQEIHEAPLPKLPGAITLTGEKVAAFLAYEDQYEPSGSPRSF